MIFAFEDFGRFESGRPPLARVIVTYAILSWQLSQRCRQSSPYSAHSLRSSPSFAGGN